VVLGERGWLAMFNPFLRRSEDDLRKDRERELRRLLIFGVVVATVPIVLNLLSSLFGSSRRPVK